MLHTEKIITFSEAAKALPRVNGRGPHSSTVWRWARKGVKGVFLETRRLGGRFVTSAEALERFSQALADIEPDARSRQRGPKPRSRTEADRRQAIVRAESELADAGI